MDTEKLSIALCYEDKFNLIPLYKEEFSNMSDKEITKMLISETYKYFKYIIKNLKDCISLELHYYWSLLETNIYNVRMYIIDRFGEDVYSQYIHVTKLSREEFETNLIKPIMLKSITELQKKYTDFSILCFILKRSMQLGKLINNCIYFPKTKREERVIQLKQYVEAFDECKTVLEKIR